MSKTIYTPREELVCGKLDVLEDMARKLQSVEILDMLRGVRHDCERMEAKLVSRKDEVERLRAENDALFEKGRDRDEMARSLRHMSNELTWTQEKARGWQNRAEYVESKLNELQAALDAAGGE